MRFARRVFSWAGIYGFLVLAPQYFMEGRVGRDYPPPITHPEYYFGFTGVALAWQVVFLVISRDPVRFRPLMPAAILEKLAFGVPAIVLYLQHRLAFPMLGAGLVDLSLGALFLAAYRRTSDSRLDRRTRSEPAPVVVEPALVPPGGRRDAAP